MKSIDEKQPTHRLRELLQRGDPAADGLQPTTEDARRLRARVLDEARQVESASPPGGRLRPARAVGWAAVAAGALGVALATAVFWRQAPLPDRPGATGDAGEAHSGPPPRQVQFTTPGGTRIVWVLYPEAP